jgi:hypothetical protein
MKFVSTTHDKFSGRSKGFQLSSVGNFPERDLNGKALPHVRVPLWQAPVQAHVLTERCIL